MTRHRKDGISSYIRIHHGYFRNPRPSPDQKGTIAITMMSTLSMRNRWFPLTPWTLRSWPRRRSQCWRNIWWRRSRRSLRRCLSSPFSKGLGRSARRFVHTQKITIPPYRLRLGLICFPWLIQPHISKSVPPLRRWPFRRCPHWRCPRARSRWICREIHSRWHRIWCWQTW